MGRRRRKRKQQHQKVLSGLGLRLMGLGSVVAEVEGREEGMQDLQGHGTHGEVWTSEAQHWCDRMGGWEASW